MHALLSVCEKILLFISIVGFIAMLIALPSATVATFKEMAESLRQLPKWPQKPHWAFLQRMPPRMRQIYIAGLCMFFGGFATTVIGALAIAVIQAICQKFAH